MKNPKIRFKKSCGSDYEDWDEKILKNQGFFYNGLSGKTKENFGKGDKNFITYMNVYKNTFADKNMVDTVTIEDGEKQNEVLYGDLLFTQSSETSEEIGMSSVWLYNDKPYLNSFCFGFRFNNLEELTPKFIGYLMRTEEVRKAIILEGQGISRINLASSRLGKLKYKLPVDINEQTCIANFFSEIDELIKAQSEKLGAYKQAKKAVAQKLFSQEVRFKKDDGSEFADWKEQSLGECCVKCQSGGTPKSDRPEYYNGNHNFLSITDMTNAGKYLTDTEKTITDEGIKNSSAWLVPANTLMLSMYATYGKVGITTIEMATSQAIIALIFKNNYDLEFMYQTLNILDENNAWISNTNNGVQKNLNRALVMGKNIIIPSDKDEQTKIANCLSEYDALIKSAEKKLEAYRKFKKAMMQRMFI